MIKLIHSLMILLTKFICLVVVLASMISCQSTMTDTGEQHKTVAEKWYALANYAESDIQRYGVTVTGKLSVDFDDPQQSFKLSHFKLSTAENINNINLLKPIFENKQICVKQCYQLLEYINVSEKNGTTLLTSYFSVHEFELFKFYGELQLLNEMLSSLDKIDRILLRVYLKSLASKDINFKTAKEFTQYLGNVLTVNQFNQFIVDPSEVLSPFIANYNMAPSDQWGTVTNNEQDGWRSSEERLEDYWLNEEPEELALLTVNSIAIETLWSQDSLEEHNFISDVSINHQKVAEQSPNNETSLWQDAAKLPLIVGRNACSFQDNYFGVVKSITLKSVEVNILGQAKEVVEGVVTDATSGILFSTRNNISFLPQIGVKRFNRSDIAVCNLE